MSLAFHIVATSIAVGAEGVPYCANDLGVKSLYPIALELTSHLLIHLYILSSSMYQAKAILLYWPILSA